MNADDTNEAPPGSLSDSRFHVGSTVAGRYRVERPIGEGAMGAVALARHVSLDETVAIKFLRPELRRDPVAIARLSREAKALARIKSDHVARVLDVGVTLSVGPYMVMEYLEGVDLGELLEKEGPLPVSRAVECVLQVCEALTVAHTAGIVHRDIKPQNLFLARHGQFETLKVLDFGICDGALADSEAGAAPYGTPSYMSPERVRNDASADHRADIWSVGVVLHELVTGRAVFDGGVFDGGELTDICARIVSDAPIVLEPDQRVLPAELRVIIARCLERDPARRYASVEELVAALAPLGTMQERFRGRTTGAFSRSMVAAELAKLQGPGPLAAPAAARRSAGLPTAALARLATRVSGGARARTLAFAGASVVVLVSLVRGAAWMGPPPPDAVSPSAESPAPEVVALPVEPVRIALDTSPSPGVPAPPVALSPGASAPVEPAVAAAVRAERAPERRARARRSERSARAKTASRAKASGDTPARGRARVRLVENERFENRHVPAATLGASRSTPER